MTKKSSCRIVILGSNGVGKTSIMQRWLNSYFSESYEATVENVCTHQVELADYGRVDVDIIDTAGSEQFAALRDLYIQNGHGFLLVYSVTSLSSFHEIVDIKDQMDSIIKGSKQSPMVVVGNKIDSNSDRIITQKKGLELCNGWGVPFFEISAKESDDMIIERIFLSLITICQQGKYASGSSSSSSMSRKGNSKVKGNCQIS